MKPRFCHNGYLSKQECLEYDYSNTNQSTQLIQVYKILKLNEKGDYKHSKLSEATSNPVPTIPKILLANTSICSEVNSNQTLKYLIYVHSSPRNIHRRQNLRHTWGSKSLFKERITRLIFVIGRTKHMLDQTLIEMEYERFQDILQGDFVDSYKNLTLKGLLGIHFAVHYCSHAQYIFKTDDDSFLNIFEIMDIIEMYSDRKRLVICPLWRAHTMRILRHPPSCMKWCVDEMEFPKQITYPQYCAGIFYGATIQVIQAMYKASFSTPFFWVDDVYISGILMGKANRESVITYISLMRHFVHVREFEKMYIDADMPITGYITHVKDHNKFMRLWSIMLNRLTRNQRSRLNQEYLESFTEEDNLF